MYDNIKKQIKDELSLICDDSACAPMWHYLHHLCLQYSSECKKARHEW